MWYPGRLVLEQIVVRSAVVYGFLLAVHLVRIAIAQNISVARAND